MVHAKVCCALVGGSGITPALATLRECRTEYRKHIARWGRPPSAGKYVETFAVLHVSRSSTESLPKRWYEPQDEAGLLPTCNVLNLATGTSGGEDSVKNDPERSSALRGKLTTDVVKATFPPPGEDVVAIVCGPPGFSTAASELIQKMGYKHVVIM